MFWVFIHLIAVIVCTFSAGLMCAEGNKGTMWFCLVAATLNASLLILKVIQLCNGLIIS